MIDIIVESLLRASTHGAVAIAVVLVGCHGFRKSISESTECWLWRLVFVQMLVLIFVVSPFQIPILESSTVKTDRPETAAVEQQYVAAKINDDDPGLASDLIDGLVNAEAGVLARQASIDTDKNEAFVNTIENESDNRETSTLSVWATLDWKSILGASWAIGIGFFLLKLLVGWRAKSAIINSLKFLDDHQSAKLNSLFDPELQSAIPKLATTHLASSPFLVGVFRPIIVLPEPLLAELTANQTREILAHEVAHLQRYDLCWDWLSTVTQIVFFFHPLVWLASSRCKLAKEIACDQRAVTDSKTSMDSYAETLLMVSTSANPALVAPFTTSMFRSHHHLKRRFHAMSAYVPSRRSTKLTCLSLICIAGLGIVPWQLTSKAAGPIDLGDGSETGVQPAEVNSLPSAIALPAKPEVALDEIDTKLNELNQAIEDDPQEIVKMRSYAIEIAKKHGTTSVEYGRVLGASGRMYAKLGDHKAAAELLTMSIDPRLASDDFQELQLDFKSELVDSLLMTGNIPKAVELATEALEKRKELFGADKPQYGTGLTGMARVKMRQVKFPEAIELCKQAKTVYKKSDTEFPAAGHATLVWAECVNSVYVEAKKGTGKSVKALLERIDFAATENAIGWESLSKTAKLNLLKKVIHFQELADPASRMVVFEKLAGKLKDEPGESDALKQQYINALIHQSNAADNLRWYPQRLASLQAAIKAAKPGDPIVCDLYSALTRTYGSLEQPENIRKTFETAVGYAQRHDLKRNEAQLIQNYARWLVYSEQNDLAEPKYQQAVEAATEFGGTLLGETQAGFGLFLHDQKKFPEAAKMLEASLKSLSPNSQLAMKVQMHLPFATKGSPVPSAADSGVTLGEPMKMNMKEFQAFQKKLADEKRAKDKAAGIKEEPEFVFYIKIPKFLTPIERGKFAHPVDAALKESKLGEVFGGGTLISDEPYSGIDVAVKDLDKGLALIIKKLKELDVPKGTQILYTVNSKKESVDVWKK